uniref:Uncharacterized protein n=1 Tax=Cannabis sativa TaxID=3483 RepID=A0A803NIX0_CANSA
MLNSIMGKIDKNIAQIKATVGPQVISEAAQEAGKASRNQEALVVEDVIEIQPIQQLDLAPDRVPSRSLSPKASQAIPSFNFNWPLRPKVVEAKVLEKVQEANLCLKRHHELAKGERVRGHGLVVTCVALTKFLTPTVGGDVATFTSKIIDQNSNNICELTVEKWAIVDSTDPVMLAHATKRQAAKSMDLAFIATLHPLWKKDPSVLKQLGSNEEEYLAKVHALESDTYFLPASFRSGNEAEKAGFAKVVEVSSEIGAQPKQDQLKCQTQDQTQQ